MQKQIDKYTILENKELLGSLIGILPDATLILDADLRPISYNEKALQFLCKNKPEKIEYCFKTFLKASLLDMEKLKKTPVPDQLEVKYKQKILVFSMYPVFNNKKIVTNFIVFIRDITKHKELEESEYTKTIQLSKLLDTAKQLTSSLDLIDVFTRIANEANSLLKAYSSIYLLEADGKTLKPQVVVDPVYADEIMKSTLDIDHSLTGKAIKERKNKLYNDVGSEDEAYQIPGTSVLNNERVLVTPFIVEDEVLGAMCLNRIGPIFTEDDFSIAQTLAAYASTALKNAKMFDELQKEVMERKNAEEQLQAQREQLELINRILRHDLTNNLVSINSALKLFIHSENDKSFLDTAKIKIDKSLDLIKRMRDLESFIKLHKDLKIYEIRDIVEQVVKAHPDAECRINGYGRVLADEAINSVIENIISNSLIHGKADQIRINIGHSGKFCEIRISDNGKSIPDDIKDKVFEESFSYGDSAQTGQGLFIVKKTIEMYGGHVFLEDNIPQGTIVVFSLQSAI